MTSSKPPENTTAGYGRRVGAWLVDVIVAAVPYLLIAPILLFWMGRTAAADQVAGGVLLMLLPFPCFLLYLAVQFIQLVRGEPTPGRKLFKLEVTGETPDGGVSFTAASARVILGVFLPVTAIVFTQTLPLFLLLPLIPLIDRHSRSLPEIVSGTRISRVPGGR